MFTSAAITGVRDGGLAAIGVYPSRPATTPGYIRYGRQVAEGMYEGGHFMEKPDLQTAERLLAEGRCVRNAGIFVFHVGARLDDVNRLTPEMMANSYEHDEAFLHQDWLDPEMIGGFYSRFREESIDT